MVGKVERWNQFSNKRIDLFNFIDIIACSGSYGIVGVQSCGTAFSEHDKKIRAEAREAAIKWLESGGKIMLIGWRKVKYARGSKKYIYKPRIKEYSLEDFDVQV